MRHDYIERVMYWLFRAAIGLGFSVGYVDYKRVKRLLQTATYDELHKGSGISLTQIATFIGVSRSSVTAFSQQSLKPHTWPESGPMTNKILETLDLNKGELSEHDLVEMAYSGTMVETSVTYENSEDFSFDGRYNLALRALTDLGMVDKVNKGPDIRYRLTDKYKSQAYVNFNEPILKEVEILEDVFILASYILERPGLTKSDLEHPKALKIHGLSPERVAAALTWSQNSESRIQATVLLADDSGEEARYRAHPKARIIASEEPTARQVAVLNMIKQMKRFLMWLANDPPSSEISQQSFTFRLEPHKLSQFLKSHYQWFVNRLSKLENESRGAPASISYNVTWFGFKRGGPVSSED